MTVQSCVVGASGRLGRVVLASFLRRGDEVIPYASSGLLNYLVFAHRWRGADGPNRHAEFMANVWTVVDTLDGVRWASGDRAVVIVSSVAADEPAMNQSLAYSVSKGAQRQVARYYARLPRFQQHCVRFNTVSPNTFTGDAAVVSPQAVADVIAFLCSFQSRGINGQDIRVG